MIRYDGLDAGELALRVGAPRAAIESSLGSTQDLAHALAAEGAPSGTVVLADEQTAGRGRAGRRWWSPPGAGIWLSLVLRPRQAPVGGALAIRVGSALRDALAVAAPPAAVALKWPNDLVHEGRKIGGVLCEARWSGGQLGWVAVGAGLNVHGPLDRAVADVAAVLADLAPGVSRLGVLEALVPRLIALAERPATLADAERAAYLSHLWMPPGESAVGLDPDGALRLRNADGRLERRTDAA